ncbi:MAG: deoxyguanosinetriphosphate triphosphohydrolase, partial [Phyllobacterium sp.]
HEIVRRQITMMVEDVIRQTQANLDVIEPRTTDDVHAAGRTIVAFSAPMREQEKALKAFLYKNLYFHDSVVRVRKSADRIVRDLFDAYLADESAMPEGWRDGQNHEDPSAHARLVADFLAGMTDTYAVREHRRLFDRTPELA